jgi:hypothetical protein
MKRVDDRWWCQPSTSMACACYQYINWSWKKNLKQWVVERSPGLLDHFGRVDVDVKKSDRTYMMWHHIVLSFLHTTISLLIPHIVGKEVRHQLETQSSAIMSSGIVPGVSRVRWQGSHYERTLEASFSFAKSALLRVAFPCTAHQCLTIDTVLDLEFLPPILHLQHLKVHSIYKIRRNRSICQIIGMPIMM